MSHTTVRDAIPTSIYRYYDAAAILLYVGVTSRGTARNREHWSTKSWWQYVAYQEVDHCDTRTAALERERELIATFKPPFNKQHNPDHARLQAIYLAFANGYQPTDESFIDLYRRLNHRVALRPMLDRSALPDYALFATLPEHFELARTMTPRTDRQAVIRRIGESGRPLGAVLEVVHGRGLVALIRVQMSTEAWPPTTVNAVLKMVDLKRRLTVLTRIEVA